MTIGWSAFRSLTERTERTVVGSLTKEQEIPPPTRRSSDPRPSGLCELDKVAGGQRIIWAPTRARPPRKRGGWGEGEKTPGVALTRFTPTRGAANGHEHRRRQEGDGTICVKEPAQRRGCWSAPNPDQELQRE